MTPTVLRAGPYRLFFFSGDRREPPHVHAERDEHRAKFWLEPVQLEERGGFTQREIDRLARLVTDNREELLRAWHDFFGD